MKTSKSNLQAQAEYQRRLDLGVAREQARKDLPLATYTEAYWKIDLHNLLHFLALRMDDHAQYEFRQYANVIGHEIVAKWVPLVWEAFLDYRLNSVWLSAFEAEVIRTLNSGTNQEARSLLFKHNLVAERKSGIDFTNEGIEFLFKLKRIGLETKIRELLKSSVQ